MATGSWCQLRSRLRVVFIYIDKSVGPRFGKMVTKIKRGYRSAGSIFRKRPRKPEAAIQKGTQISVWNIPSAKKRLPFHKMFCCSRIFSTGTIQKVLFHLLSNRIFRKPFVNVNQLMSTKARFKRRTLHVPNLIPI